MVRQSLYAAVLATKLRLQFLLHSPPHDTSHIVMLLAALPH